MRNIGLRELSFFTGRGDHLFVGGPDFFGVVKGGDQFFLVGQRGPEFFEVKEGGPEFFLQIFFPSWIHLSKIVHAFAATFLFAIIYVLYHLHIYSYSVSTPDHSCPLHYVCEGGDNGGTGIFPRR